MKCEKCENIFYSKECPNCKKIAWEKNLNNNENKKKENIKTHNKFKNNINTEEIRISYINKKHANFSIRLMAMAIDTAIIGVPVTLLMNEYIADAIIAIIIIFLWIIWKGQSIGKKLVNIKIVNENYEDINLKTAIIRYIGYYISTIIFFIGYAIVPFRKDKMALHDLIAKTHVIHTDKDKTEIESDTADKVLAILSMFIGIIIIISLVVQYQQKKEIERINKNIRQSTNKLNKQLYNGFNK